MGNQSNLPESRRQQQSPFVCCGPQTRQYILQEATSNVINPLRSTSSKLYRASDSRETAQKQMNLQQTGSSYHNKNDISLYRKQQNKQKVFQSDLKKSGFAKFQRPTYGAYNTKNTFGNYGVSNLGKQKEQPKRDYKQYKQSKPTPLMDFVRQKHYKSELKRQRVTNNQLPSTLIGEGPYSGRASEFDNNQKIIKFLSDNHVKQPFFKFYQTKDNTFVLNNSTIKLTNRKKPQSSKYEQQLSSSNLQSNPALSKLQQPIELIFQIDARIILATCLLIVAIVIVCIGGTVVYSEVGFFICLMVGIILYVFYLIICFIYNDVFMYLFNVRSFDEFEKDYKKLLETGGDFAYHLHLQTPKQIIKECYLLSHQNKYTKIQYCQNQNKQIQLKDVKNQHTSFLMIKYKAKSSFMDAQSQFNTINYFSQFLDQHKSKIISSHNKKNTQKAQKQFHKKLVKTDFNYELQPFDSLMNKPQSAITVCYMEDEDDAGWIIFLFIVSTMLGLCIIFLCIFEAYNRRQFICQYVLDIELTF